MEKENKKSLSVDYALVLLENFLDIIYAVGFSKYIDDYMSAHYKDLTLLNDTEKNYIEQNFELREEDIMELIDIYMMYDRLPPKDRDLTEVEEEILKLMMNDAYDIIYKRLIDTLYEGYGKDLPRDSKFYDYKFNFHSTHPVSGRQKGRKSRGTGKKEGTDNE